MLPLSDVAKEVKHGPFTFSITRGIRFGIERYRREQGLRSGAEAARELLAIGLSHSDMKI